jgi:DUF1365 family protein
MKSAIFQGIVWHHRYSPKPHKFNYRVFMMYLDLAELDVVFKGRWFWSTRRPALARFRREHHFGDPSISLDACVRDRVEEETGRRPSGPIRLLTNLSYFGYCFNPVSFYYCFDARDETLESIIAEVTNTPWGERTLYVLSVPAEATWESPVEFAPRKVMHVSPFMQMDVDYNWRFSVPGNTLTVRMENARQGKHVFNAGIKLERREITGLSLAALLLFRPLMTVKVIAGIHWQALRLWLKGTPVYDHPNKHQSSTGS